MTVPIPLQVIYTKTTTASQTLGSELQSSVITAILAEGWTLVSGTTYRSPSNSKSQFMRVTLGNSGARFDVQAEESDGTVVTTRTLNVDGGGSVQEIHASSEGFHVQNTSTLTEKLWTFLGNLVGEPATLTTAHYVFINGTRDSAGTADGNWNNTNEFYHRLEDGTLDLQDRVATRCRTFANTVVPPLYPAGDRRFIIPRMMLSGPDSSNRRAFAGFTPGCYLADSGLTDKSTITPRIDTGVNGTFEVMQHNVHSTNTHFKYLLRTA